MYLRQYCVDSWVVPKDFGLMCAEQKAEITAQTGHRKKRSHYLWGFAFISSLHLNQEIHPAENDSKNDLTALRMAPSPLLPRTKSKRQEAKVFHSLVAPPQVAYWYIVKMVVFIWGPLLQTIVKIWETPREVFTFHFISGLERGFPLFGCVHASSLVVYRIKLRYIWIVFSLGGSLFETMVPFETIVVSSEGWAENAKRERTRPVGAAVCARKKRENEMAQQMREG